MQPERLCQRKIPVTPSEIEPATFRPVAQCLNRLRHRVPQIHKIIKIKISPAGNLENAAVGLRLVSDITVCFAWT